MSSLDLAVLGNCSFSALVDRDARIVWSCMPRFDGDPIFCSLMNGVGGDTAGGAYAIELEDFARSEQYYLHNTAILVTTLYDTHGAALEITDFAPRFKQLGRIYRPVMIVRQIRPVIGTPRIRVRLNPAAEYGGRQPDIGGQPELVRFPGFTARVQLRPDQRAGWRLRSGPATALLLHALCQWAKTPSRVLPWPHERGRSGHHAAGHL